MIPHLCQSSPSPSSLTRFINPMSPLSLFTLKPRTHFSESLSPPIHGSQFVYGNIRHVRRQRLRTSAFSQIGFGGFESAQPVLEAAAVLTAIIIVHETGHFLAAYLQGIRVSKFAIGFGPILVKFNSENIEYSIRAFPLGGFVGFPDNDPDSNIPVDDKDLLKNRPIFDRILVVSAGVIANIVFAYVILFTQVLSIGLPVQEAFPGVLVPQVRPFSAASRDGLIPGDVILGINGVELLKTGPKSVSNVVELIKKSPNRTVLLKIARGENNLEIGINPDENSDGSGRIGVQLSPNVRVTKVRAKNLLEALNFSGREFLGLSSNVLDSLKQIFVDFSDSASKVSGPVAIIAFGAEVARSNVDELFQFAAALNLNLAIINLLPLPALDGGTLALILVEAARGGKKLPLEIEQGIMSSGIVFVISLGLFLIIRDTLNLDFVKDLM
ncbi:S2P endopeptidase [Bertholletia excelsa]